MGRKAKDELEYLYDKLDNIKNYSVWHNRSSLLKQYANEENLSMNEIIEQEYELCTNAFYTDPSNQSAWIYHRWLLSTRMYFIIIFNYIIILLLSVSLFYM
jgi:geranylgeranyl transferase type-2 subunit alpha